MPVRGECPSAWRPSGWGRGPSRGLGDAGEVRSYPAAWKGRKPNPNSRPTRTGGAAGTLLFGASSLDAAPEMRPWRRRLSVDVSLGPSQGLIGMNPFLALVLVAAADPTAGAVDQFWAENARAAVPSLIDRRLRLSSHLDEVNQCVVIPQPGGSAEPTMPMRTGTTVNEISQHGNQLLVKSVTKSSDSNPDEALILCRSEYYNFKLTKKFDFAL